MFFQSAAVGVRQEPPPVAEMGRSRIGSGNNSPFRVVPDLGQLSDHGAAICWPSIVRSNKDAWDVLQDDESGSHFPNDSERVGPEVAIIKKPSGDLPEARI